MSTHAQITATANQYGVPPALALAVAEQESNFNQAARGAAGEIGMFQLMPGTAGDMGVDPFNLADNIEGGIKYLALMLSRYGGDQTKALAAYNGGPGNMDRGTTPAVSWRYASEVLNKAAGWEWNVPADSGPIFTAGASGGSAAVMLAAGLGIAALLALMTR